MQILSAADSISPALARTRLMLFAPFRPGRSWKIGITGYFAFASTVFLPFPLFYFSFVVDALRHGQRGLATAVLIGILLLLVLFAVFFYVFSRLQFAFLDMVLHGEKFVAPAWRKYGPQTWPWIGAKVVFGTLLMLVSILPFLPLILDVFHQFAEAQKHAMLNPAQPPFELFAGIIKFEFVLFAVFGLLFLLDSMLTDFVLPSLALEAVTLQEAFRRFFRLFRQEPGQMTLYVGLKLALTVAGYIGAMIAYFIGVLVVILVLGIVLLLGYFVLSAMHVSGAVMAGLGFTFGGIAYVVSAFYIITLFFGAVLTFLQAYALYFLGGRYPLLGDLLQRSTPVPAFVAMPPHLHTEAPPNPYAYLNVPPKPPTV